jgi:hypothetical protein
LTEPTDADILEFLDRNPDHLAWLREEAARNLEAGAGSAVSPERVDAEVVAIFRRWAFGGVAKVQEFVPPEVRLRIYKEEEARLRGLYGEDFSDIDVGMAVVQRLREEYPDAL